MERRRRDELYPRLKDLTDEQVWKIWLAYDRVCDRKGRSPLYDNPTVTTHDEAIRLIGFFLSPTGIDAQTMKDLENDLELSEEFKLASWLREFRRSHEDEETDRRRILKP